MQRHGTRIGVKEFGQSQHWAYSIADYLIEREPTREEFVCASGITPSGRVHFGNFREVITTYAVVLALQARGKQARFVYSWDNFDRFRKVPAGIDESYQEHIGKPLSEIPSPTQKNTSYAQEYQNEFEKALSYLNIKAEYRNQATLYPSGTYDEYIFEALRKRKEIADILLSYMTEKGKSDKGIVDTEYRESYYPISLYSRFTGKDATEILSYDGKTTVRYRCKITKKEEEVDLSKDRIAKLGWKVDWAMRWKHEQVCFEPGGGDHAAPDGSYTVSSEIAKKIFDYEPPVFTEYGFVGIQGLGTKMSSSSGKNITPGDLLSIYETPLLAWMYLRRLPSQTFSLAFDTEVYRQYDEIDRVLHTKSAPTADTIEQQTIEMLTTLYPNDIYTNPIPFRQITGLAQVVQWDEQKILEVIGALSAEFDSPSVISRMRKAKAWIEKYNNDEMIVVRDTPNTDEWQSIDEENKTYIHNPLYLPIRKQNSQRAGDRRIYLLPPQRETHR